MVMDDNLPEEVVNCNTQGRGLMLIDDKSYLVNNNFMSFFINSRLNMKGGRK